jgi:hypothetical protein
MPKTLAANLVTFGRAATTVPAAPGSGKRFLVRAHRSPPAHQVQLARQQMPCTRTNRRRGPSRVPRCRRSQAGRSARRATRRRRRNCPARSPASPAAAAAAQSRHRSRPAPQPGQPGLSLRSWPSRPGLSRGGSRVPSRRPQDDTHTTDKEQNPLVTDRERNTVRDRCRHTPPRLSCARSTTRVQSSREESQSRLPADKRAHLPVSDATPPPQEGQVR